MEGEETKADLVWVEEGIFLERGEGVSKRLLRIWEVRVNVGGWGKREEREG